MQHIKTTLFAILTFITFSNIKAQDIVFSQFEQTATYYNPAYAGHERSFAGGLVIRNQWGNTQGRYFSSYVFGNAYLENAKSGLGFDISYNDANSGGNTTLTIGGRYNYHLAINRKWTSIVGLSASYTSVQINSEKLTFEDQLNTNNTQNTTAENINLIQSRGYLDLGIGTVFYIEDKTEFSVGLKHINFPKITSLTDAKTSIKPMISTYFKHRIQVAGSFYRPNSKKVFIVPSLLFLRQAQFNQIKLGSAVEVELVQFGIYYRTGLGKLDNLYSKADAIILMGGLKTDSFNMTYTYDMNVSAQRLPASTHEISLIYIKKTSHRKNSTKFKKRR